ncbi:hypothetical protein SKAU_G00090440 [Synaphobranchus kaupii]|uniref:Uncharacterized protein n=1 Tax=Synaphobranchus kaupii TaxID=118154 RepID=A0A9Q1J6E3_SYNKA|nr:hypothetical protein SKAU_G00090440 [Synaphobranchus kaupii]
MRRESRSAETKIKSHFSAPPSDSRRVTGDGRWPGPSSSYAQLQHAGAGAKDCHLARSRALALAAAATVASRCSPSCCTPVRLRTTIEPLAHQKVSGFYWLSCTANGSLPGLASLGSDKSRLQIHPTPPGTGEDGVKRPNQRFHNRCSQFQQESETMSPGISRKAPHLSVTSRRRCGNRPHYICLYSPFIHCLLRVGENGAAFGGGGRRK